jgi:hypothetical protein
MPSSEPDLRNTNARFVVADTQITSQLGDESVILELKDGVYYGLDAIGTRVWNMLVTPCSIGEIGDSLCQDYDVDADTCRRAIDELVRDLLARGLIVAADERPTPLS